MATPSPLDLLKRGFKGALGFGTAITLVHLFTGVMLMLVLNIPPMTSFAAMSIPMELGLALVVGMIFTPALLLPRGDWIQPGLTTVAWIVMERIVAVDPSKLQMWIGPSVGGFVVYAIGRWIWSKKPAVVVGISLVLPVVLVFLPALKHSNEGPKELGGERKTAPAGAPNVLMIVMDTTRAMSTSAYGYGRDTTPSLELLAKEGLLFEDATAPATWSLPAHASLFTGTFPSWNNANAETRFLDDKLPTMAEWLQQAGYDTACFSANPYISDAFGLTRGFMENDKAWASGTGGRGFSFIYRFYDVLGLSSVDDKGGAEVVGNIDRWISHRGKGERPTFIFVNFLEAHFPFHQLPDEYLYAYQDRPIEELREIGQIAFGVQFGRQLTDEEYDYVRQPLVDMYDGGVKYTDHLVGEVIDIWRKNGLLDNTIVVVVGDHGEVMGEHRAFGHVTPVVEEDLRVPFVMRYPPRLPAGSKVSTPITTTGLFATVMDLAGLEPPAVVQIKSLLPGMDGDETVGKPIIAERFEEEMLAGRFAPGTANGVGPAVNPRGRFRVYKWGPWKLVQHTTDPTALFNLEQDPGELNDLAASDPALVEELAADLSVWLGKLGLPELDAPLDAVRKLPTDVGDAELEALKALGYIGD